MTDTDQVARADLLVVNDHDRPTPGRASHGSRRLLPWRGAPPLAVTVVLAATACAAVVGFVEKATPQPAAVAGEGATTAVASGGSVRPAPTTRPVGPGSVQKLTLRAADAPGGVREVLVYRPGVPDSARLPVVYFLHGLPGSDSDLLRIGAARLLDRVFRTGQVQPFVLVFPDGAVRGGVDSEWTDSADSRVRLESFVTKTVVAAVEGDHPRDRAHRAIAGFSMGGYGAIELALRHPSLYGQVASLAGYFRIDDPDHMFADDPGIQAQHDPGHQVRGVSAFRLLLLDGADDNDPVTGGESARYATLLRENGIAVTSGITPGGHSPQWALAQLPAMASFLNGGWPDLTPGNPRTGPTR